MDYTRVSTDKTPDSPMIYAYTMPGVEYLKGYIKIGKTRRAVEKRASEGIRTAGLHNKLEWYDYARYKDGSGQTFTDTQFHNWLDEKKGAKRYARKTEAGKELFKLDPETSLKYFNEFANREIVKSEEHADYVLRREQQEAVYKTRAWYESGRWPQEFLWNAKPRFGKTLTAYALIRQMGFEKVLVVSNRPSVSNSWAEDFYKFLSWREEYSFISDNEALKIKKPGNPEEKFKSCVQGVEEFAANKNAPRKMIVFESLQGLKGSVYFGGGIDKLKWIEEEEFDLLIVDESHEGVDTMKTERAFDNIKRKHTLYLSGTPFRQMASARFSGEQIYNWSYADEQEAKLNWQGPEPNPYERLPKLCLFTYQMSEIIRDKAQKGIVLTEGDDAVDYAFDLNEFFLTNGKGKFAHEEDVRKFIRALTSQEKYPFSTPESRESLSHTLWYLNRVASARALKKLLQEDEVFRDYEIILAAGNEQEGEEARQKAYDRVKDRVATKDKTITLTVGQLTTGVTIPQWSAVLMLCNLSSPAAYMQAAFRAQNPWMKLVDKEEEINGEKVLTSELRMKENAYVFDFDPARTLLIYDEFANNLTPQAASGGGTGEERQIRLKRLLNFLPVIGEDNNGKMVELDAAQVLSIPRRLKSQEVVRHGFMSNFLFQNIGKIFSAPAMVRDILAKMRVADGARRAPRPERIDKLDELPLDAEGNPDIGADIGIGLAQGVFGDKIYGYVEDAAKKAEKAFALTPEGDALSALKELGRDLKNNFVTNIIKPASEARGLSKRESRKIARKAGEEIDREIRWIAEDYERDQRIAESLYEREKTYADNETEKETAKRRRDEAIEAAEHALKEKMLELINKIMEEKTPEVCREVEEALVNDGKRDFENEARARLRGFSRAIPAFLMAYGDDRLTLANFDQYVDDAEFQEVTGISLKEFIFLRDGGTYRDEKTGEEAVSTYQCFDSVVFNDAIREFLQKKKELANYFREDQTEDIFDYIPPQKTNQVFTPRSTVKDMVDMLERENPGCFEDPNKSFADLYMKSGMYISEIVKRLYRSDGLKKAFPDAGERIRHILRKQVYGAAASQVTLRIAINYILGFDPELRDASHNFILLDVIKAGKAGCLQEQLDEVFGG